jgi:formate dehydrogenase subunit delta
MRPSWQRIENIEETDVDIDNLIKMANQIGSFYESLPDADEASREIAGHIKKFWAPRMRIQMLDYIESEQGAGLSPVVLASIRSNKDKLQPDESYSRT